MYGIVFAQRRFVVEEYRHANSGETLYIVCDKWKEKPNYLVQDAIFYTREQAEFLARELEADRDHCYGADKTDV